MKHLVQRVLLLLMLLPPVAAAQQDVPAPRFVPPDIATAGEEAYHKDIAIIETNCTTWEEARALWIELTRNGALISVMASPRRMLGWVPAEALEAVQLTHVQSATGGGGVTAVAYTADAAQQSMSKVVWSDDAEREAEDALLSYLGFIRRVRTDEERQRQAEREMEIQILQQTKPPQDCMRGYVLDEDAPRRGDPTDSRTGGAPSIQLATRVMGVIVHSSFFLESASGTGSFNWDATVYDRYRNFYVAAFNYWTSFASKYGKTLTGKWRLYSPYNSNSQVTGEPTSVGEDVFIREVLDRMTSGSPGSIPSGWTAGPHWNRWYNNLVLAGDATANYAVCGWIGYKPSGEESIWPHAVFCTNGTGDVEGIYFALDTQYWQAGHDPFSASLRNVIAHEMGHLWGGPDEYANDAGCYNWSYRGAHNINCQQEQNALGRPGLKMRGYDGIMGWNYIAGNSVATPVHTGVRTAAQMSPIRCFSTEPANIPITVKNCDDNTGRTYNKTMCLPIDFDYCHKTWVPVTRVISGTTWYFDHWRVRRNSGSTTNFTWSANELSNWTFTSTLADPVTDIVAVFTSTPPDFNTANTTVEAWLAPFGSTANPNRAIALRWRNKYDMSKVQTRIEYERTAGNWVELTPACQVLTPFNVGIGQWTGAYIIATPQGTGTQTIQAGTQYRFRIVGYFNTVRGAVSNTASITTRPASPNDTVFCYDTYEPNSETSPRVLTSSGPGMTPYVIKAACPISAVSGEFSWYHPKKDYYRITVIGVNTLVFGEKVEIVLTVRPGSDFEPKFHAQRVGTTTHTNAVKTSATTWRLYLTADGEYLLKVEPQISTYVSNDFVDRTGGHFGFGEYTLSVGRDDNEPVIRPPLCLSCVRLKLVRPIPGLLVMQPPFPILHDGVPNTPGTAFDVLFHPMPGMEFEEYEGGFGKNPKNPLTIAIGPTTKPGEYELGIRVRRIPPAEVELVIIHPNGPYGPFENRIKRPVGTLENALATAPTGYEFVGWSGDTVATTNPLPVVMWRHKKLIAIYRIKPCQPQPMIPWQHQLVATNARQGTVMLTYGMVTGAGDGLEAGQPDLPPAPPPGTFDVRWINIPGSEGSTVDLRAVKPGHVYQLRLQTGSGTAPVILSWSPPAVTPNATYIMKVTGDPDPVDLRVKPSYTFSAEGTYLVTIEVKEASCPPPTKPPSITVTPVRVLANEFPCIKVELLLRNRAGNILPFYDPYLLEITESGLVPGTRIPMRLMNIEQGDSLLVLTLCSSREDTDPRREIHIIPDTQDPDEQPDTLIVPVDVPVPTGQGKLARITRQNSGDWEMVSLPLDVASSLVPSLYTDPMTMLYDFNTTVGAYQAATTMTFGTGYWLKTADPSTTFIGYERLSHTWSGLNGIGEPFGYGWNMIGSLSRPLAVSMIQQTPSGSLRSIFGWNPATGYVVPTTIESGKGYWVRVNPGTTLKMEVTGATGGGTPAYLHRAATLPLAARLDMTTPAGAVRSVALVADVLTASDIDILQIPHAPPATVADLRTAEGTLHAAPGVATLVVQAEGEVVLALVPAPGMLSSCVLQGENGELLGVFDAARGSELRLIVNGRRTVQLVSEVIGLPVAGPDIGQNYPNPFAQTGETVIPYRLDRGASARLSVVDVLGRTVRVLAEVQQAEGGSRYVVWNGRDDDGGVLPAGMYLLRLETGTTVLTKTMTIIR